MSVKTVESVSIALALSVLSLSSPLFPNAFTFYRSNVNHEFKRPWVSKKVLKDIEKKTFKNLPLYLQR